MLKSLIKLRKKYWLPFKWSLVQRRNINGMTFQSAEAIMLKRKEIEESLIQAQSIDASDRIKIEEGRLLLADWFIKKYNG